jgi:hypothetical protein
MAYLNGSDPPDGECEPDAEWHGLLEGMGSDINTLATRMLADQALIPVREQENLVLVPKLWRRWGWKLPEDRHTNPV